jgi:hypothetical protein
LTHEGGLEVVRVAALDAGPLARGQVDLERGDDGTGDLVLEGEDVLEVAIVALRPPVAASISCALIRARLPARRTLPSST